MAPPLPIIPKEFGVAPIGEEEAERIKVIEGLAKKKAVTRIVNACDAGREGELIFWLVFKYIGIEKPFFRMWMQSMTDSAIRQAYAEMLPASAKAGLLAAARSRSEADWLVGINGSRAFTQLLQMATGQRLQVSLGRVQTPTLALIVYRELHIRNFKPRDYFEIQATFNVQAGSYTGRWMRQQQGNEDDSKHRITDLATTMAIVEACKHVDAGEIRVREESKPSIKSPGKLFDLTSLQREANNRFGFTAKKTLDLAQSLYEKHKVTSYPRTDSSYLPDDYPAKAHDILADLQEQEDYAPFAGEVIRNNWVAGNKTFDSTKVSDHFAVIPTGRVPANMDDDEQKVYDLIVRRFLAVFYPAARYQQTIRVTEIGHDAFLSTGKVLKDPGWLAIFGKAADDEDAEPVLCALAEGEAVVLAGIQHEAKQTSPPKRFTEANLLSAMEHASADIADDEDARQAMAGKGLGTPATRAATIEGLVDKAYIGREGKQLIPSDRGVQLIQQLERLGLTQLTSAKLTGEWEHKLGRIDKGNETREVFMAEIADFTRQLVDRFAQERSQLKPRPTTQACPDCGFPLLQAQSKFKPGASYWECSNHPTCQTKCDDAGGKPGKKKEKAAVSTEHLCPECGKGLSFKRGLGKGGRPWKMWTCSGFPECSSKFDDAGGKPVFPPPGEK